MKHSKSNTAGLRTDSELWTEEWHSVQFAFFLTLNIDANEVFKSLSKGFQTLVNVVPHHMRYNLQKSPKQIAQDVKSLDALKEIVEAHAINQHDQH